MFEKIPKKLIIGLAGLIILLAGAYFLLAGSAESPASLQVATSTTGSTTLADSTEMSQAVTEQLNSLQEINIDTDLFTSEAFTVLEDYSVVISPQDIGRDNPFAPATYVPSGRTMIPSSELESQSELLDIGDAETGTTTQPVGTTTDTESDDSSSTSTEPDDGSSTSTATSTATSGDSEAAQ